MFILTFNLKSLKMMKASLLSWYYVITDCFCDCFSNAVHLVNMHVSLYSCKEYALKDFYIRNETSVRKLLPVSIVVQFSIFSFWTSAHFEIRKSCGHSSARKRFSRQGLPPTEGWNESLMSMVHRLQVFVSSSSSPVSSLVAVPSTIYFPMCSNNKRDHCEGFSGNL